MRACSGGRGSNPLLLLFAQLTRQQFVFCCCTVMAGTILTSSFVTKVLVDRLPSYSGLHIVSVLPPLLYLGCQGGFGLGYQMSPGPSL